MAKFSHLSVMNTFVCSWFCSLSLSSGILLTHVNLEMFAASDLEGAGECLLYLFIISPVPAEATVRKLEYTHAALLVMEEGELAVYFKMKTRIDICLRTRKR